MTNQKEKNGGADEGGVGEENKSPTAILFADHRLFRDSSEALDYPFEEINNEGEIVEVTKGVHWLRMPLPFSLDHINLYLLEDGDGWAIVDTGVANTATKDLWEYHFNNILKGKPITKIIVTHFHPDHVGLAGWLHEKTDAPLYMSRSEFLLAKTLLLDKHPHPPEEFVQFYARAGVPEQALDEMRKSRFDNYERGVSMLPPSYLRLYDGQEITIGDRVWRIVVGSGHSPEHACLYNEADKLMLSGDQVLPRITSNVSVYPMEPMADPLGNWLRSMHLMKTLDADTFVLPSHNKPFKKLHLRADQILAAHLRRLRAVWELAETPKNAIHLFPVLFKRQLSGIDFIMGLGESLAHLHYLERKGVMKRLTIDGVFHFEQIGELNPDHLLEA
jgi:glyoxylase-like metal-dependent hydrolase (beta-lactamase superfamily II)